MRSNVFDVEAQILKSDVIEIQSAGTPVSEDLAVSRPGPGTHLFLREGRRVRPPAGWVCLAGLAGRLGARPAAWPAGCGLRAAGCGLRPAGCAWPAGLGRPARRADGPPGAMLAAVVVALAVVLLAAAWLAWRQFRPGASGGSKLPVSPALQTGMETDPELKAHSGCFSFPLSLFSLPLPFSLHVAFPFSLPFSLASSHHSFPLYVVLLSPSLHLPLAVWARAHPGPPAMLP